MLSNIDLDKLEKSRQKDSDWVLQKLNLLPTLQKYGHLKIAGAKALGVMLAKDIDISVVVDKLNLEDWQELVSQLIVAPHVRNLSAIDYYNYEENNRYDPINGQKYSLYISINNILGPEGDKYDTWECQIHLIEKNAFDETKITGVRNKITTDKRINILRLKYWANEVNSVLKPMTNGNYKIASPSIYEAVLDKGVEDISSFIQSFESTVPDRFRGAFKNAVTQVEQ